VPPHEFAARARSLVHDAILPGPTGPRVVTKGRREEVIPSAARLLKSMRGVGYDLTNAVADLVDNSVSAGATRVDVTIHFDGPDSWIRVADDGAGMGAAQISEAMRLGSARDYESDDLGKFGLGLKTASLSQARSITVASRSNPTRRLIDLRVLDLDDVEETDKWEIVHPTADTRPTAAVEPLRDGTGTVVLWTKLDRVLDRNDPWGGWARRHLLQLAERLDLHLGMVFERFIRGAVRGRMGRLAITINGTAVEGWDPYCLDEKTEELPTQDFKVAGGIVRFRPYVLPPRRDFSTDAAWNRASGPNQWNRQQGLYVYRGDRMIQSGGWSYLRSADEHVKLARAALEFWPDLDEAFQIDISKMRVKLPEELRDQLKAPVATLTKRADDRYRISGRDGRDGRGTAPAPPRPPARPAPTAWAAGTGRTGTDRTGTDRTGTDPGGTLGHDGPETGGTTSSGATALTSRPVPRPTLATSLERAAERADATDALSQIRAELRTTDPDAARDLGW